jgi:hypothetical protein
MKAVGVPERKLKESSHYGSFVRIVESTFIMLYFKTIGEEVSEITY